MCDAHLSPSHALSQPGVVSQLGLSLDPWSSLQGCPKGVEISSTFPSQQQILFYQVGAPGFVYYLEIANQIYLDV